MIQLIEGMISFAVGGAYGGSIGNVLLSWEQAGFFSYILPFLLIFAIVFGILTKVKVFPDNKALNAVIALAVGFLSLQFNFVPVFFAEIFPRLGIGLAIILAAFILLGLALPAQNTNATNWFMLGGMLLVFVFVLSKTFSYLGYTAGGSIIIVIIVLAAFGAIINAGNPLRTPQMPQQYWQTPSHP